MNRNLIITLGVVAAIALAACAPGQAGPKDHAETEAGLDQASLRDLVVTGGGGAGVAYAPPAQPAPEEYAFGGGDFLAFSAEAVVAQEAPASSTAGDRLVIKNAYLSIVVDNPNASIDAMTQMAEGMGGFVVSLNTYKATFGPDAQTAQQATMTLRVPSERLNEALAQIKALAVEVNSETISGQDVTSEYTDLKSRLQNLEAAERQLQSIMAEATKTEDVLAVYNQLVYTREQIEVIKGQVKYFEESAAMSAISLDILPNIAAQPIEVGGWHPEGAAKQAIEDTIRFLQSATDGLIYFAIARLPFLLVVGIPTLLLGRWAWKRARKPAAGAPTTGAD